MTYQAGVKTVVVGGRPTTGPMQAASGNRGARLYSAESLDWDISNLEDYVQDEAAVAQLPNRSDTGMWINFAGFNIRDQLREEDASTPEAIPLQFRYEAADCRIYFTLANVYNMTQLWRDVYTATWVDTSLCVEDSTGYASARKGVTAKPAPKRTAKTPEFPFKTLENITPTDLNINATISLYDVQTRQSLSVKDIVQCSPQGTCRGNTVCVQVPVICASDHQTRGLLAVCVPKCSTNSAACTGDLHCRPTTPAESKAQMAGRKDANGSALTAKVQKVPVFNGYCEPRNIDTNKFKNTGCPRAPPA
jgi:hypothetical protein